MSSVLFPFWVWLLIVLIIILIVLWFLFRPSGETESTGSESHSGEDATPAVDEVESETARIYFFTLPIFY